MQLCELHYGLYQSVHFKAPKNYTPVINWSDTDDVPDWAAQHLHAPRIAFQVNDLLAMYKAVEAGLGIARMPLYMHNFYLSESVQRLNVKLPKSKWGVWLLSHADLRKTARVQVLKEYLRNVLEENKKMFIF